GVGRLVRDGTQHAAALPTRWRPCLVRIAGPGAEDGGPCRSGRAAGHRWSGADLVPLARHHLRDRAGKLDPSRCAGAAAPRAACRTGHRDRRLDHLRDYVRSIPFSRLTMNTSLPDPLSKLRHDLASPLTALLGELQLLLASDTPLHPDARE